MAITEFLSTQLEREVERSRKALEQMPEGKLDWKPHDRSMNFGYLAELAAIMPSWVAFQVNQESIDLAPADGSGIKRVKKETRADYLKALDEAAALARQALSATNDAHLQTRWQLKVRGAVVQEGQRDLMIQDTFNHMAHHRGQMTVYLRLMGAKVPALFGPSADDTSFA